MKLFLIVADGEGFKLNNEHPPILYNTSHYEHLLLLYYFTNVDQLLNFEPPMHFVLCISHTRIGLFFHSGYTRPVSQSTVTGSLVPCVPEISVQYSGQALLGKKIRIDPLYLGSKL